METKNEQMPVSETASASSIQKKGSPADSAASSHGPEAVTVSAPSAVTADPSESSADAEKKTQSKRSSRSSGKRKSSTAGKSASAPKGEEKPAASSEQIAAPTVEPMTEAPAPAEDKSSASEAKKPEEKSEKKQTSEKSRRKPAKAKEPAEKTSEKASEKTAEPVAETKEPRVDGKASSEKKTAPKKRAPKKENAHEASIASKEEKTVEAKPAKDTAESKAVASEQSTEKTAKPSRAKVKKSPAKQKAETHAVSKESVAEEAPSVPEVPAEPQVAASTVDVTVEEVTVPQETAEPSAKIPETVLEHIAPTEEKIESVDVSGTPPDTFVFFSPGQLAEMEAAAKKEQKKEEQKAEEVTDVSVSEAAEPQTSVEAASEEPKQEPERKQESRKRGDPHERDVMDKERISVNLFSILEREGEMERRTLIEETMKMIPLTEEERKNNQPTSLSNRVRSVIGSLLADQLSNHRIIASGRKLTLPSSVEVPEEEDVSDLVTDSKAISEEEPLDREAALDIEIELTAEASEHTVPTETPAVSLAAPEEPTPAPVAEETDTAEEEPLQETLKTEPAVREPMIRRAKQTRGDRRSAPSGTAVCAILITEDEIERVILNALRRNSATKNDLFASLKHVYVEPNRLSKEEENRIYTIAGNVLQKLVNRGTLQNSDGRYLQKPSQRILNPGIAPGAYSTGNVEARFITELNRQSGDFFEQFAARLLEKYFEMSNVRVDASYVVGGSDDNGIDIMIETTDWLGYRERVFVQAKKRATQPVTLKEVREFYGALCAEEGTRGVFITTSSFCMEASKMIGKIRNLIAIDKRKLFALAEHCEVGLIRDEEGRLLLDENLFLDYDV